MRHANTNLGIPLEDFKETWKKSHLTHISNGKKCAHHNARFDEGWIHLAMVPYYPALNRFSNHNELANEIVRGLEEEGEYDFGKNNYSFSELEPALEEVCGRDHCRDIEMIIADKMSHHLMLDRKSFTIDGSPNEYNVQWYIKKHN